MEDKHLRSYINKTIKGNSPKIKKAIDLVEKAAKHKNIVLITGETGTGKELAARIIHECSDRNQGPFVVANTAAIPKEIEEQEFFGVEKPFQRQVGYLELAQQGTLFIDEIASLSLDLQVKLLQAFESKESRPAGSIVSIPIDIRVVLASQKDLAEELEKGNIRPDFYLLLQGIVIEMPPLRERENDIWQLANYFMKETIKENKLAALSFTADAKEKLLAYHYPGNIRELKAIVESAVLLSEQAEIDASLLKFRYPKPKKNWLEEELTLEQFTLKIIHYYLEKYNGNVLLVAKKLGIGKSTIYRILKK